MGASKTDHFTNEQQELSALAKAMAHPARIAIIEYLIKVNACVCGDIVGELPLAQPTVSQHLKELKNAGLIKGTIEGNSVCYCIDRENWERFGKLLGGFFASFPPISNCC
jgi:DNA-binding transcriptional ArsR family regulator